MDIFFWIECCFLMPGLLVFLSGDARTVFANRHRAIQCSFVCLPTSWTLGRCIGAPRRHAQAGAQEKSREFFRHKSSMYQMIYLVSSTDIYYMQRCSERRCSRSETADLISYTTAINTCADVGQWAHALKIHSSMLQGLAEESCDCPA